MTVKCPYCDEKFETRKEESEHRAKHFEETENLPNKTIKDKKNDNIVKNWKKDAKTSE